VRRQKRFMEKEKRKESFIINGILIVVGNYGESRQVRKKYKK